MKLWLLKMLLGGAILTSLGRYVGLSKGASVQSASAQPPKKRPTVQDLLAIAVVQPILFGAFWAGTGLWWAYAVLWLLPGATIYPGILAFRGMTEHADPNDPPNYMMTFISNPVERFIIAPFNFNFHAEHHLFTMVPYNRLPALRKFLLAREGLAGCVVVKSYVGRFFDLCRQLDTMESKRRQSLVDVTP